MNKIKEEYTVEGYLTNKYTGELIYDDFRYVTYASSFEEAERNAVFRIKTEKLGFARNYPAQLNQTEGIHFTYRRSRDV